MKKLYFALFLLFLYPTLVGAASLYFEPARVTVAPGDTFAVKLFLDSASSSVNALQGVIRYQSNELELQAISDGDSIINFWLERPALAPTSDTVSFSGIIPGGFSGVLSPFYRGARPGKILDLVFVAKQAGEAHVELAQADALQNDGRGTSLALSLRPLVVAVSVGASNNAPVTQVVDQDPPEPFTPLITRDVNLGGGRWVAVWDTRDTGSGMANYQIQEHHQPLPLDADWGVAVSPQMLADQSLGSYVSIRARDLAGNERVVTLSPRAPVRPYPLTRISIIIILCGIALLFYFYFSRRRP